MSICGCLSSIFCLISQIHLQALRNCRFSEFININRLLLSTCALAFGFLNPGWWSTGFFDELFLNWFGDFSGLLALKLLFTLSFFFRTLLVLIWQWWINFLNFITETQLLYCLWLQIDQTFPELMAWRGQTLDWWLSFFRFEPAQPIWQGVHVIHLGVIDVFLPWMLLRWPHYIVILLEIGL